MENTMPVQFKTCKCGAKIPRNIRSCDACEALRQKTYDTSSRDDNSKKFYNSKEWQRVRYLVLSQNPLCSCGKEAKVVDHIVEIRKGGAKLDISNLQPMCMRCHAIKTAKERGE